MIGLRKLHSLHGVSSMEALLHRVRLRMGLARVNEPSEQAVFCPLNIATILLY